MASIILAGSTGLVGGHVARILADSGHILHLVTRRRVDGLPDNIQQHVSAPENWPSVVAEARADIAISCLGTTIKTAGSNDAFRAVDFELLREFAGAAKQAGAKQFMSVSSAMADSSASNFYLKTKGEAEDALHALDFDRLDIVRPGLLKGDRQEFRLGESIGIMISPLTDMLLQGSLRRYRSIDAVTVAKALAALTERTENGANIHENDSILALAAKKRG